MQVVPRLGGSGHTRVTNVPTTHPTLPGIPEDPQSTNHATSTAAIAAPHTAATTATAAPPQIQKADAVTNRKLSCLFPATSPPVGSIPELCAIASSARQRTEIGSAGPSGLRSSAVSTAVVTGVSPDVVSTSGKRQPPRQSVGGGVPLSPPALVTEASCDSQGGAAAAAERSNMFSGFDVAATQGQQAATPTIALVGARAAAGHAVPRAGSGGSTEAVQGSAIRSISFDSPAPAVPATGEDNEFGGFATAGGAPGRCVSVLSF